VTEGVAKPSLFQPNKERVGKTMPEAEVAPQANGAAEANGAKGAEGEAPDTFGKQVGIIVPPPDIKVIVDRTAQFIARLGKPFEREIIARDGKNKQFQFLYAENHYHAYYQDMIQQIKSGEAAAKKLVAEKEKAEAAQREEAARVEEEKRKAEEAKKKLTLKEKLYMQLAKLKVAERTLSEAPPADVYTVRTPSIVYPVDVDIIKLTAQFVARNGRQFLAGLTAREQRNPQFEFLNPAHPLFTFFQKLVDAYAKVVIPPQKLLDDIRAQVENPSSIYQEALVRSGWERIHRDDEAKKAGEREEEENLMSSINWHEFVVVETVTFAAEDDEYLPPPCKDYDEMLQALSAPSGGPPPPSASAGGDKGGDMDVDMDVDMDTSAPKKVEPAAPRLATVDRSAAEKRSTQYVKSPITGQLIHVDEMEEHMRIALLDPKWKEKKEALLAKQRETVSEANADIARNLAVMARARPDVFVTPDDVQEDTHEADDSVLFQQRTLIRKTDPSGVTSTTVAPPTSIQPNKPPPPKAPAVPLQIVSKPPQPPTQPPTPADPTKRPPQAPPFGQPPQFGMPGGAPRPGMPGGPPRPGMPGMPGMPGRPPMPGMPGMPPFGRPPMPGMPPQFGMPGMPGMPPRMPGMPGMPGQMPGMPGMPGMPPMPPMPGGPQPGGMPGQHPAPPPVGMPPEKKQRTEAPAAVVSEAEFIQKHPGALTVRVVVPLDDKRSNWKFNGQVLEVILPGVGDKVSALKAKLKEMLNEMPTQKMRLRVTGGGVFLKDAQSFAQLNLASGTMIDLGVKERGRRRR